jgi:hypothetical protein
MRHAIGGKKLDPVPVVPLGGPSVPPPAVPDEERDAVLLLAAA